MAWQRHSFHVLIELISEGQSLQSAWKGHLFHVLVEVESECQAFQAAWKRHSFQAIVEHVTEAQALQTLWPSHFADLLGRETSESQAFKTAWEGSCFPNPLLDWAKVKAFRLLGKVSPSSFGWSNAQTSSSGDHLARSHSSSCGWNDHLRLRSPKNTVDLDTYFQ